MTQDERDALAIQQKNMLEQIAIGMTLLANSLNVIQYNLSEANRIAEDARRDAYTRYTETRQRNDDLVRQRAERAREREIAQLARDMERLEDPRISLYDGPTNAPAPRFPEPSQPSPFVAAGYATGMGGYSLRAQDNETHSEAPELPIPSDIRPTTNPDNRNIQPNL